MAFRQGSRPDLAALRRRVLADLQRIGVIRSERDVLVEHPLLLEPAYAIYDRQRPAAVRGLLGHFDRQAVHSIGRWGRWSYGSMEDAILQGLDLADQFNRSDPVPTGADIP